MEISNLKTQILEQEFTTQEEEDMMIKCADVYLNGKVDILGKHSYELASSTPITSVEHWAMFLSLPPVQVYRKTVINDIIQASRNKAVVEIMEEGTDSVDVRRLQALESIANELNKTDNQTTIVITRVPPKEESL